MSTHSSTKFAFDKTFLKSFRRYRGAGDLGLFRMTSTIYGIAMLVAAIGIPAAMIFCKPLTLSIEVPK